MQYQNQDATNSNRARYKRNIIILILLISTSLVLIDLLFICNIFSENKLQNKCVKINTNDSKIDSGLVLYFHFNNQENYGENNNLVYDFSGNGNSGTVSGAIWNNRGGKFGDGAFEFSGPENYIQVNDADELSPSTFKYNFTVSFWIKFDQTSFIGEGSNRDYINYLGKGSVDNGYEWFFRQYNSSNAEGRNNRISFYAFNPEGGLGAGSYFQKNIERGKWEYITGVINETHIKIYNNGILQNTNLLSKYNIQMKNTKSDLYIGKSESGNYFSGSIDELRIYNKSLNDCQIWELYNTNNGGKK